MIPRRAVRRVRARSSMTVVAAAVLAAGMTLSTPAAAATSGSVYTVRRGDWLSGIAARFGVPTLQLAATNDLVHPGSLHVGERIVIPSAGHRTINATSVEWFRYAARVSGVPLSLLEALCWQESGWQNGVVSSAGAVGMGQIMPATARFIDSHLTGRRLSTSIASQNVLMSGLYLDYLIRRAGGSYRTAVAAYYQGLASLRYGWLPSTVRYVNSIFDLTGIFGTVRAP